MGKIYDNLMSLLYYCSPLCVSFRTIEIFKIQYKAAMNLHYVIAIILFANQSLSRPVEANKGYCSMTRFNTTIIVERCDPVSMETAMCIGTCKSISKPVFMDQKSMTTQICEYCLPIMKQVKVKLTCKKRLKGYKEKIIGVVTGCQCGKPKECPRWES